MRWLDEAAHRLPKPAPREPENLRRDILNELADHLELAYAREREAAGDQAEENAVRARVLERFGDPIEIARRLWWDAMKEKVMRDRIILATVVIVGLAVVLFTFGMYQQMRHTNEALLATLKGQLASSGRPEMTTVSLAVHQGTRNGPPVKGVTVEFWKSGEEPVRVSSETDGQGRVSFGPVDHGLYCFELTDPVSQFHHSHEVTVFAGYGKDPIHIAIPELEPRELALKSPLPPWVEDDTVLLYVAVEAEANTTEGDNWSLRKEYLVGHRGTWEAQQDVRAGSFAFYPPQSLYPGITLARARPGNEAVSKPLFLGARPSVTVSPAWRCPISDSFRFPSGSWREHVLSPDLVEKMLSEGTVPLTQEQYDFCVTKMREIRAEDAGVPEGLGAKAGRMDLLIHKAWPVECSVVDGLDTGDAPIVRLSENEDSIDLGGARGALLQWDGGPPRAEEGQRLLLMVPFQNVPKPGVRMTLDLYGIKEAVTSMVRKDALSDILSYSSEQMKDMIDTDSNVTPPSWMLCAPDVTKALSPVETNYRGFVLRANFVASDTAESPGVNRVTLYTGRQGKGGVFVVAATDAPATVPGATP